MLLLLFFVHLLTLFLFCFWLLELILKWVAVVVVAVLFVVVVVVLVVVVVESSVMLLLYPSVTLITCTLVRSVRLIRCNAACPKMRRVGGEGGTNETCVSTTNRPDKYRYIYAIYDCMTPHTHAHRNKDWTHTTHTDKDPIDDGIWQMECHIYILRDIHAQWSGLGHSRIHRTEPNITEKKLMAYTIYGIISKRHTIVRGISTKSLIGLVGETIGGWLRLVWALSGWFYLRVCDPLSWLMAHLVGCVTGMLLKVPANLVERGREKRREH